MRTHKHCTHYRVTTSTHSVVCVSVCAHSSMLVYTITETLSLGIGIAKGVSRLCEFTERRYKHLHGIAPEFGIPGLWGFFNFIQISGGGLKPAHGE
jgi:hypothetical protein